jgi:hypothetical protein
MKKNNPRNKTYAPIWEKLKNSPDHSCTITAIPALHARIIKAVIKKKNEDLGYKVLLAEEGKVATLLKSVNQSTITFRLMFSGSRLPSSAMQFKL